jgi:hypothetical protein
MKNFCQRDEEIIDYIYQMWDLMYKISILNIIKACAT